MPTEASQHMSSYTEFTQSVGDQVVDAVAQAEERAVSITSSLNSLSSKFLPSVGSLPTFDALPSASDVVSANAALIGRVLDAQTKFLLGVLDASPAAEPKPAKKSAAKA